MSEILGIMSNEILAGLGDLLKATSRVVPSKALGIPITLILDAPQVAGTLGGQAFSGHLRIVATSTTANTSEFVPGFFRNTPIITGTATINGTTTATLDNSSFFFSTSILSPARAGIGGETNVLVAIENSFFAIYKLDQPAGPITGPLTFSPNGKVLTDKGDLVITGVTGEGTFQVLGPVPCLHPDTMVQCENGLKPISEIRAGDIVINHKGKSVPVLYNMRFGSSNEFVRIQKDALGPNLPTKDLLIRRSHPVLVNGKKVKPTRLIKDFSGVRNVRIDSEVPVWSLCTKEKQFIVMEGVPVAAWAESKIQSQKQFHFTKF